MSQQETTARFDFALEFPQNWQACLQKIQKDGYSAVSANIYWGLHETSPGIRDFSKSSKLKVEKFLQVAASVNLKVDLVFGFMPSRFTFPDWIMAQAKQKALVPASIWDGVSGSYFISEIPALENKLLYDSFLSFLGEALTFLPLYQEPEGALRNIFFDAGIYKFNQSITEEGSFSAWLEEQYGSIEVLNKKYQTAFNSFSNAGSKTGFRVLLDKRPWLAAFDYKSARCKQLESLEEKVQNLSQELKIKIKQTKVPTTSLAWNVAFDSVFVEGETEMLPFSPEALVLPQSVLGFRFLQSVQENFADWNFSPLPLWKSSSDEKNKNSVVICGKYLSHAGIDWIKSSLREGSDLFFPFGNPQFDEEMKLTKLLEGVPKDTVQIADGLRLQIHKFDSGRLILPEPLCAFDKNFPERIRKIISSLDENRRQA